MCLTIYYMLALSNTESSVYVSGLFSTLNNSYKQNVSYKTHIS